MSKIKLGTKAETLERLIPHLSKGTVLPLMYFSLEDWNNNRTEIQKKIADFLGVHKKVVVRSSSMFEDGQQSSNAGGFKSRLNIDTYGNAVRAVEDVFDSFEDFYSEENQVLIQPHLKDVSMSGVIFTRDLATLAPYYIVNYDDKKGVTDSITSGVSNDVATYVSFKESVADDSAMQKILEAVKEVEVTCGIDYLDIEFAVDTASTIYIFQVRPIVIKGKRLPAPAELSSYILKIKKKVRKILGPNPYILGDSSVLSVMTDWNPAEMIGVKPRPLSISLYKELITDRSWAYQRFNYGYRNVRSFPLLYSLLGIPYIDIRASINSFIPNNLDEKIARKLSAYYLQELKNNPFKHDKIEFDIIYSCYYAGVEKDLEKLRDFGFDSSELEALFKNLLLLTKGITSKEGLFYKDLEKIELLKERQRNVHDSDLPILDKIYWLIEDCKRYGTLPFAGIARSAFIATQMLKALVTQGRITKKENETILKSFKTIAKVILESSRSMSKEDFIAEYGHLRPGTYDILSPSYEEEYEHFFSSPQQKVNFEETSPEKLKSVLRKIDYSELDLSQSDFYEFAKKTIEGREYAKFIFTRSVHMIFKLLEQLGENFGFSKEDMSYVSITTIMELYSTLDHRDLYRVIKDEIDRRKEFFELSKLIKLPDLIMSEDEVYSFHISEVKPNFITMGKCRGEIVAHHGLKKDDLEGKIIFIENADPGYDWIFGKNILGLITMYGGANSHMSIRANEMDIPAVIGCGEKNYHTWCNSSWLEIDCENKLVKVLK